MLSLILGGGKAFADNSVENAIQQSVESYFSARALFLETGDRTLLSSIASSSIIDDEVKHRNLLRTFSFSADIEITEMIINEGFAQLKVSELKGDDHIMHDLEIYEDAAGMWIVLFDGYRDTTCGFTSLTYMDPNDIMALQNGKIETEDDLTDILNSSQLRSNFLSTAQNESGYLEKASDNYLYDKTANPGYANYTKYGAYYGWNPTAWCALYVSWCAEQANLGTSRFPLMRSVVEGVSGFTNLGRYHNASGYTPKAGDVFFIQTSGTSHTGIVVSVSGTTMQTLEGNALISGGTYEQVGTHYRSVSAATGFGNPNYCWNNNHTASSWTSDIYTHWRVCSVCGSHVNEASHSWVSQGSYYQCTVCGRTSTSIPVPIN